MKLLHHLSILSVVILFILVSCQKEEEAPSINEYMTATVDGKAFKASTFVVARAGVTTSINGTIGPVSTPESIGLSIENARVGTFVFSEGATDFAVYKSTADEYLSMSGTLQITAISPQWIEGSFSFVAHSINNPAEQVRVSAGEFKMKFD